MYVNQERKVLSGLAAQMTSDGGIPWNLRGEDPDSEEMADLVTRVT